MELNVIPATTALEQWFPIAALLTSILSILLRWSLFLWGQYQSPLPLTEKKSLAKDSKQPRKPECSPHIHYHTAPLLLGACLGFLNLLRTPRCILARGRPTFVVTTKYDDAEKERWSKWEAGHSAQIELLNEAGQKLLGAARNQLLKSAVAACLCIWIVVDSWRAHQEAVAIQKSRDDISTRNKGGVGGRDRSIKRWERNWRLRFLLIIWALQLGLAGWMDDLEYLERKFVMCLNDVVGVWPAMEIEWMPVGSIFNLT